MSALLEIEDLKVTFPMRSGVLAAFGARPSLTIDAVAGVSLSLDEGETYAIVGESGSGKTTLARAVNGLVDAQAGSIRFRGHELRGLPPSAFRPVRHEMAMMFQDPVGSLSPRQTVKALVTEPYKVHGLSARDLDSESIRLLEMVGLNAEIGARYPYQLSGGQARRVGVARALALNPKLIVADEPTAGLDVSVQGELLNLLGHLQDSLGVAMLIITHNLNVVRHIADRVGIMYLGRIVEEGRSDAVFHDPKHPYTLALMAANPSADPDADLDRIELRGEPPSLIRRPAACEFHPRCPFVRDRCARETPALNEADGHLYRCHWDAVWRETPSAGHEDGSSVAKHTS